MAGGYILIDGVNMKVLDEIYFRKEEFLTCMFEACLFKNFLIVHDRASFRAKSCYVEKVLNTPMDVV